MGISISVASEDAEDSAAPSELRGFLIQSDLVLVPKTQVKHLLRGMTQVAVIDFSGGTEFVSCKCDEVHIARIAERKLVVHAAFKLSTPQPDGEVFKDVETLLGSFPGSPSDRDDDSEANIRRIVARRVVKHATARDDIDAQPSWCRFVPWC